MPGANYTHRNDPECSTDRDAQPELSRRLQFAQKHILVVYGIDNRGVHDTALTGSESGKYDLDQNGMAMNESIKRDEHVLWENGSAMSQLAAATGGIYFHGSNDLFRDRWRAFDDKRERYVITYFRSNDAADPCEE